MATRKKDITTKKSEINGKIHNRKWKKLEGTVSISSFKNASLPINIQGIAIFDRSIRQV